jgi:hypothetical protein
MIDTGYLAFCFVGLPGPNLELWERKSEVSKALKREKLGIQKNLRESPKIRYTG